MGPADPVHSKLADWDDDDPSAAPDLSARWNKVVILKHMFTLKELEVGIFSFHSTTSPDALQEDPAALLDIKEDIRDECSKLGEVTNVVLFDKEADGVASVRFSTPEAAVACVKVSSYLLQMVNELWTNWHHQVMNGRFFSATRVEAYIADGSERFKKTNTKKAGLGDDESEEDERLDNFGAWLEGNAPS